MQSPLYARNDHEGTWFREGHGVEPDIEVIDDPSQLAKGTDPQLARAIKEVQDRIAKMPKAPTRPAPEKRVPKGGGTKVWGPGCGMRDAGCAGSGD